MKLKNFAFILAALCSTASLAQAENWMAHVRAVYISPDSSSSPVSGVEANNVTIPELDFSYFWTPNWSTELILGTSRHEVSLDGTDLGKVSLLPPTVTIKYHHEVGYGITPYVGVGVNHTLFYDVSLGALSVSTNSTGLALQVGADYQVADNIYVNLDIKKAYIKTDVASGGNYLTTLDIDPMIYGLGLGMKF